MNFLVLVSYFQFSVQFSKVAYIVFTTKKQKTVNFYNLKTQNRKLNIKFCLFQHNSKNEFSGFSFLLSVFCSVLKVANIVFTTKKQKTVIFYNLKTQNRELNIKLGLFQHNSKMNICFYKI